MAFPLPPISYPRMDPVIAPLRSTLGRLQSQVAPTTSYLSGSLLASLDALSSRLPSSQTLEVEARKHLAATLSLARAAGAHSSDVLSAARKREAGYVKVVEKWYPAAIDGWADFEHKVFLLSNGTLEGALLRGVIAGLAILLLSLAMLSAKRRRSASGSYQKQPSVMSALSQTESSTSEADSSYTSEEHSDEDLPNRPSAAFRRSTSPLGRSGQSPAGRASRHFAVGSASKRADKRSSLIRITSSDPSSSLCHMPVELDLLSPTSSSSAQRSSSPSQAAALAVLKRRRKRMGVRVINSDLTPLGDEIAAILAKDSDTGEEGGDSPRLPRFALELDASADGQRGQDPVEDGQGQTNHLSVSSSAVRAPSPLKKAIKNRPPMRIKRSPSPLPPDAPEPIPERNSSYHKLNGVVQAIKPRVVGGDRTDAPPSILRKKSQVWSDRIAEEAEATGATMSRNGSRNSAKQDIGEGAAVQAPLTSASRNAQRSSSGSNVEAWRSSTLIVGSRSLHSPEEKLKTFRAIKLTEPDWAPYVTIHERARERVEKKREKDAAKKKSLLQSASTGSTKKAALTSPTGSVKRRESIRRRREELRLRAMGEEEDGAGDGGELAYSSFHSPSAEDEHSQGMTGSGPRGTDSQRGSGSGSGSTTPRRRSSNGSQHQSSRFGMSVLSPSPSAQGVNRSTEPDEAGGAPADADAESDFWFERYIPSTAAAGRDWDWRKRRARVRAEAEAQHNTGFIESLRAKVDEDGDESYTMDFDGQGAPGDDGDAHSNGAAGSGGSAAATGTAGGSGQYVINGHVFSHGLVGTSLGYTPSGGSRASPSGGASRNSPVGGSRERRR